MLQRKGTIFGATAIIVALAVLAAAVGITVNYNETLRFNAFQSALLQVDEVAPKIDGWFRIQFGVMDRDLAFLNSKANLTKMEAGEYFTQVLRRSGSDYIDIYVGWPDGSATFGGGWVPGPDWDSRLMAWYIDAAENPGKINVSAPLIDADTGKLCVRLSSTVATYNSDRGVYSAELPLDPLTVYLNQANQIKGARSFLVNSEGDVLVHPNQDYLPTPDGYFTNIRAIEGGRFADYWETIVAENNLSIVENKGADGAEVHFTASRLSAADWYLISEITPVAGSAGANFRTMLLIQGLIILAVFICLILINLLVSRSAAGPPKELTEAAEKLSLGMVDLKIDPDNYTGEMRYLAESLSYIAANEKSRAQTMEAGGQGDYSVSAELRSDEDKLNRAINHVFANVNNAFNQINDEASHLAHRAAEASAGLELSETDSAESAALFEQISALVAAMLQKADKYPKITDSAAQLTDSVTENLQKSGALVKETTAAIEDLNQVSLSIEASIDQISGFATQTNLIALNAAMEAAMAGEHGQRFAELADNMREFAVKIAETAGKAKELSAGAAEKATLSALQAGDILPLLSEIESGVIEQKAITNDAVDCTAALIADARQIENYIAGAPKTEGQYRETIKIVMKDVDMIAQNIVELTGKKFHSN